MSDQKIKIRVTETDMTMDVVVFSKRPSQVKMNRKLDFPHPRIVFNKQTELSKLRDELFLMLGVSYAV